MSTIILTHQQQLSQRIAGKASLLGNFIQWAKAQEENRLLWTGIALAAQGCILLPITMMTVLLSGMNFYVLLVPIISIAGNLLVNLAALPAKITVPVFFLGLLADVVVILAALALFL